MIVLTEAELLKRRRDTVKRCKLQVEEAMEAGRGLFQAFFPSAKVKADGQENYRVSADILLDYKIQQVKTWVDKILEDAIAIASTAEPLEILPERVTMSKHLGKKVIQTILEIFTCGRDLSDNDYYFISDVGAAINLSPQAVQQVIDQARYEIRRDFFSQLLHYLTEEQCFKCAVLMTQAIRADDKVHPAEFKYIENITQLLRNDQSKLDLVENEVVSKEDMPQVDVSPEIAVYLYKYLCEIVMCDGEYDSRESRFLKDVGLAFGFDHDQQDEIIQPVASALMVKAALFPKD